MDFDDSVCGGSIGATMRSSSIRIRGYRQVTDNDKDKPVPGSDTVRPQPADDDARRERPTPEGDGLDPTRYGDWEKNGRCIDF